MSKELCISSTPHETRLAIVEDDQLTEIYYERENEYTLAGSIYKGRVTRVLPGMQSAFVDIGLERDAFLYVTDFLEEAGEAADFEKPQQGRSRGRQQQGDPSGEPLPAVEVSQAPQRESREPRDARPARGGRGSRNAARPEGRNEGRNEGRAGSRNEAQPAAGDPVEPGITLEPAEGLSGDAPHPAAGESHAQDEFEQGTRRWRGRRSRRRGGSLRGAPREGAAPQTSPAYLDPASVSPAPGFPGDAENGRGVDEPATDYAATADQDEPLEDLSGIALSAQAESPFAAESFSRSAHPADGSARPPRREGRENNRRDGRREGRGSQDSRRGSRPDNRPDFSREHNQDNAPASTGEPIFLPGESLSKYGQKAPVFTIEIEAVDRSDEKPLPVYTTATPSTLVDEDALTWDGFSAALPGESLSKNRKQPQAARLTPAPFLAKPPAAPEFRTPESRTPQAPTGAAAPDTPASQGLASHESQSDAASHPAPIEILHAVHAPSGTVSFEEVQSHDAPPVLEPLEAPHEGTITTLQSPGVADPVELEHEEGELELEQTEQEFEPDHASASYRVDPAAPSEFRIASPVEEPVFAETDESLETTHTRASGGDSRWDWQESAIKPATIAPEPLPTHGSFQAEIAPETEPAAMHSHELPHAGAAPAHPEGEEDGPVEQMRAFSPGTGLLEEEVIDEDEYDFSPMHAHSDEHDLEEIEEETLDNAAGSQLGDLVRDQHIHRRVSGEAEAGEGSPEDEFEEDESEAEGFSDEEELSDEDGLAEEEHTGPEFAHGFAEASSGQGHADPQGEGRAIPAPRRDDSRRREGGRGGRSGGRSSQRGRSGGGRHSVQASDLPIISDLLKQGQEVLVQIAKEPIAKKGARITSHIALPGRFLVFMPTVNHVGVSRKISSDEERLRLKRILTSEKGTAPGGFIVRTAADGASEEELRADLRFLISLWTEIKTRSDSGKSPALIYHDLNLVERVLRDQVSDSFSTIWVDSEVEYERIVRFLNRFEPALVRRVKLYTKEVPLFEQFGIQEEISKALRSKVWLKSGGSIVINQTEALVAIDINTGKYVGKTARLEDTIVKTNLDAIPEIVRQIRLRDLGGIIIIDFIDMDERKNRNKVMQALEDELKSDRAPSKVLQFNDFGLVAITRKRVKQSLERTLSTQCNICAGTGMVKSPVTVCNEIYTEMRKMHKNFDRGDVMLRVHPEIVKTLKGSGKWLTELEEMIGRTILIKSDPALHPEQFDIH